MSNRNRPAAVRQFPEVRAYMTRAPLTTTPAHSLTSAVKAMRGHNVRHLPVVDDGQIVGVLSQRDVLIMESLPGVNPTEVRVEEAMVREVFTVSADTPLAEAIETMIDRKIGSAVVTEGPNVVGVFTTIDALRALHQMLQDT